MSMKRTTAPTIEPVTRTEAKLHLRVEDYGSPASNPDDTLIDGLIQAAREWCEVYTGRAFLDQTWELKLDEFRDEIRLPRSPLIEVSSITYLDTSGDSQTLATSVYRVDEDSTPPRITREYAQVWPSTRDVTGAVTITYRAGYLSGNSPDDATEVPQAIKQAVLLIVGALYENREDTAPISINSVPWSARALLAPYMTDKHGVTTG